MRRILTTFVLASVGLMAAPAISWASASAGYTADKATKIVQLRYGDVVKGSLDDATDDMDEDFFDFDAYSFTGKSGDRVTITAQSSDFDSYVVLYDPSNTSIAYDDDGGDLLDSKLTWTLPRDGTYRFDVEASDDELSEGDYTVTLSGPGGTAPTQPRPAATSKSSFSGSSSSSSSSSSSTTSSATAVKVSYGDSIKAKLASGDNVDPDKHYFDIYTFSGRSGDTVVATASSSDFDAQLFMFDPDLKALTNDDDGGGGLNAKITYKLTKDGTYRFDVLGAKASDTGSYTFTISKQ